MVRDDQNEPQLVVKATQRSDEEELANPGYAEEDAFGNEDGAAIRYKTMEWWYLICSLVMLAENISLGVLALPQALAVLGIVPGLLVIFILGVLATYSGLVIGQFKLAFPKVQSYADCGEMIAGRVGKEILAVSQVLILVFIMAAHILSFHVALNAITDHGMCTIVFSFFGLIVCFALGLPRTLKAVSFLSIASSLSIVVAVTVAMISIGIYKPDVGKVLAVTPGISVVQGLGPVMNIMLAYGGHVAFFSFAAELRDTRSYPKALLLMQISAVTFYMVISVVIYYYAGPLVASPALGSAPPLFRKICYGLAMPTIVIAGVVNGSVACKYVYRRIWQGTDVIHQTNFRSLGSWVAICAVLWTLSWLIAEAIPNFNLLLSLIAALFCSWFSCGKAFTCADSYKRPKEL
ncbi:hypothetical protein P154DRAFT_544393 [Amniculicola lignicola CBS 123094]|uniref:Amino acid transporter transmembrane domain-containing protein n=1 Tax=Amniculicola lignicola CBS 123094 TaxID=1392246 RepID=A0A6A5WPQ8_9PLEO|nr:hypothetical protein P154DRAFT_544393 [Amniculicola lignicola CBS 123094]